MQKQLHDLVKDTLIYLEEEGKPLPKKSIPTLTQKLETPKPAITPPNKPLPPKQPPTSEKKDPLFSMITKHLPHMQLKKEIPEMQKAEKIAIVITNQEDLPFIKKLASAIQNRLSPVSIVDGEKLDRENTWEKWFQGQNISLIITQKDPLPTFLQEKKQILLAPISTYENNTEQKKELWTQICQRLPKSS